MTATTGIRMRRRRHIFIRNLNDEGYLDTFFVSAITAFLLVRLYLYATGFPKIGGSGLHIAHMLWGGLFMVLALVMVFNFLDRHAFTAAAVVGGAGFGLFIDELGKFITSNNDYFFQPTASIIYVVFVLMYLGLRSLQQERDVTDREYLLNAVEMVKDAVIHEFDRRHVARASFYLSKIQGDVPLVQEMRDLLTSCPPPPPSHRSWVQRLRERAYRTYLEMVDEPWFHRAVAVFFLLQAVITLVSATVATFAVSGFTPARHMRFASVMHAFERSAPFWFSAVALLIVVAGIGFLIRARGRAYRLLEVAMLLNVFLTEVFLFYDVQFVALYGLAFNLVGLLIVHGLIAQEQRRARQKSAGEQATPLPPAGAENVLPRHTAPVE